MKHQIPELPTPSEDTNKSVTTWALPEGAIHRFGDGRINEVAFSADGAAVVLATMIGVWWYDLSTESPIALWETERGVVFTLAFSGRGDRLAVGNYDGIVKVLDVPSGVCLTEIKRPLPTPLSFGLTGISRLVYSADGEYLAASTARYNIVHLWHAETGEQLSVFSMNEGEGSQKRGPLIFSKDCRLLTCAVSENARTPLDFIRVWDVSSGESVACLRGHTADVYALSFSPCGALLASGDTSGTLREWEIATGKEVRVCAEYAEKYQVIPSYTASGALRAAGVYPSYITVWDVDCHEKLETFQHRAGIGAMCFENGSHLAVASRDFKVCRLGAPSVISTLPTQSSCTPLYLTFSPDSQTLACSGTDTGASWNVATQAHQRIHRAQTRMGCVSFNAAGRLRALGTHKDGSVSVWDVETKQTLATLKGPGKVLNNVRWFAAPTSDLWASGVVDGQVHIYDRHGKQVVCRGHTDAVRWLTFSPDETRLASASRDKTARLWDVASGEEIAQFSLTWVLDDALYKYDALGDSRYKYDPLNGDSHSRELQRVRQFIAKGVSAFIETVAFSPCGNILAGGLLRQIRFWDVRTSDVVMSILLPIGCHQPYALAFSPCGAYLASGSWWHGTDKVSIRLWDVATGENIATLWGHPTDVQDLAFSPDGRLLASGSYDGTILLWDMMPYLRDETS